MTGAIVRQCLAGKTDCVNKTLAGLLKCHEQSQKRPAKRGAAQDARDAKVIAKSDNGSEGLDSSCLRKLAAKHDGPFLTTGDRAAMEGPGQLNGSQHRFRAPVGARREKGDASDDNS